MEQNTMVEKMMKKDQIIHPIGSLYAESNAVAKLELILWHKYKQERKE